MEFTYDDENPPGFVLDNGFPLDYNVSVSLQPSYYDFVVPGFGPTDPFYMPIAERLYPFREITSEIIYLWKDLDPDEKKYIIRKYKTFYPRDDIFYDPYINYGWDNLYRFWYMDGNYIDDIYLNDEGWILLTSLRDYLEQRADKNLVDIIKKECCTRDKKVAQAIWDVARGRVKDMREKLDDAKINDIKEYFKKNFSSITEPNEKEIKEKFDFMQKCYNARRSKGGFNIEKFYEKIVREGFTGAPENFKKYLLFKKKYLDKKTLKKL